ncbi:MAG: polysaccharide pyruvyl transferase family protein [Bacillota bacterium]
MRKAAIITIISVNHGNRLQNYATQEVLRHLGLETSTIVYHRKVDADGEPWTKVLKRRAATFVSMTDQERYNAIKTELLNRLNGKLIQERCEAFRLFTQANIRETDFSISDDSVPDGLAESYDFFVTGSDQVWNPSFRGTPIYFLTFAPMQKRIAYAASFGVSELPARYTEFYRKCISEIPYLSVREQAGADIVKTLTGKDALVLVDPTMMLSKERWLSVSNPADYRTSKSYLITYFVGPVDRDITKRIRDIARRTNLEVVQLASFKDKRRYTADPAEFIDYINSADIVFTDSFHGAVFSILLETPFVVCDRKALNSRIETLLATFKLQSRRWHNCKYKDDDHILCVDFSHVPPILEAERKKALDYLKMSLNSSLD